MDDQWQTKNVTVCNRLCIKLKKNNQTNYSQKYSCFFMILFKLYNQYLICKDI